MSYSECFDDRVIIKTVFGEKLTGRAVNVGWYSDSSALGYYSILNIFLMIIFIMAGFWRLENKRNHKRLSLLAWQVSILFTALGTTTVGIIRFDLFDLYSIIGSFFYN